MLAFSLPLRCDSRYDPVDYAFLGNAAVAVSGLALYVVQSPKLTARNLSVGATLMGVGICVMHYTGMAAMRMSPPIRLRPAAVHRVGSHRDHRVARCAVDSRSS